MPTPSERAEDRPDPIPTVANQSTPFQDVNLFELDAALQDAVRREGGQAVAPRLAQLGAVCGSREAQEHARLANDNPPRLLTHDLKGRRLDTVEFHPSWHWLMSTSAAQGLHCSAWQHLDGATPPRASANVERAAALFLAAQMEAGHCCPITMTSASIPVIELAKDAAKDWLPKLTRHQYDQRFLPLAKKHAATVGMGMTERQGGTDVRANISRAEKDGTAWRLRGHKWFMSAPMCDAFLVLAQAPGGLTCFLLPRFRPDDTVNGLHFQRLKDKLGNRSNASSEVEIHDAHALLIGEEGRGVATIIEMLTATRLDCAIASAGLMRRAVAEAIHHCRQRQAFGRPLAEQPVMAAVLADLAIETEAATALAFRLARSFDRVSDPRAAAWRRLMTPVTKYWVCKVAQAVIGEAMECLGGNGYVEDGGMPRLYREAPVNSIWEGAGNVMALDVLRVLQKEADSVEIVLDDLGQVASQDAHLEAALERVRGILHEPRLLEARARALLESLALLAAGCILRVHAPSAVADAFIAARLSGVPRFTYGQGLEWSDTKALLARALPQ
jgi:putative acyl-CoA dehydrogenase